MTLTANHHSFKEKVYKMIKSIRICQSMLSLCFDTHLFIICTLFIENNSFSKQKHSEEGSSDFKIILVDQSISFFACVNVLRDLKARILIRNKKIK